MPKKIHTPLQLQLNSTKSGACSLDDSLNPQRQMSIMAFMNTRKRPLVHAKPTNETTMTTPKKAWIGNQNQEDNSTTTAPAPAATNEKEQDALCRPRMAVTPVLVVEKEKKPTSRFRSSTTTRKKKPMAQLFLDLGQANFGKQSVCPICGMLTVHGVEEDRIQHEQICDVYKNGVELQIRRNGGTSTSTSGAASTSTSARVVSRISSTTWIAEIRPTDSLAWQQKLQQCLSICNQELGFAMSSSSSSSSGGSSGGGTPSGTEKKARTTAFLYISHKRVCGLVTAEPVTHGYWMETASERSLTPQKALVGIYQLWTLQGKRGQGIATQLVDAARSKLIFGMQVPKSQVAFSSPTQAGLAFAKNYAPDQPPLVYEYRHNDADDGQE
jgi:N-acetyltransferase